MAPLIIGSVFILIGLSFFLFLKKRKLRGLIPFLLGASLLYIFLWGPLSNSDDRLNRIISLQATTIREIQICPSSRGGYDDITLVKTVIHIRDTTIIAGLGNALNKGQIIRRPGNSRPDWACLVKIITTENTILRFGLIKQSGASVIKAASSGEQGWIYGSIRADEFGNLIEELSLSSK